MLGKRTRDFQETNIYTFNVREILQLNNNNVINSINYIIDNSCNIDILDDLLKELQEDAFESVLLYAIRANNEVIVHSLLEKKTYTFSSETAIRTALMCGHRDIANLIVDYSPNYKEAIAVFNW